jgi:putative ABC transport system ATP-binding protein
VAVVVAGGVVRRSEMASLITLEDISRVYETGDVLVRALDGVSLEICEGEFVAVMGSSGSGKSTLMNILGCLDRPTAGRYFLDGREVSRLDRSELAVVRNRVLGFVFQSFNLLTRTSALENVELPLLYQGIGTKERHARARASLSRVGLQDRADHHPNQLSGGQQQRVAIARALVGRPRVILADEPTGNLDVKNSGIVFDLLTRLAKDHGQAVVLVTHNPDIANRCDSVRPMRDGLFI